MPRPPIRTFALLLVAAVAAAPARAVTYTWNQATDGNWSTASWTPSAPPAGGAADALLVFGGSSAYTATNDLAGTFTLNKLTISNTAATGVAGNALSFTGTGAALTLAAGSAPATVSNDLVYSAATSVTNSSGSLLTLGGNQTLTAAATFTGTGSMVNSGILSGAAAVTKSGTGTLTLTGANTYAGATTVSAGTLQIGNGGTAGALGTGTTTVAAAGTLAFNRSDTVVLTSLLSGAGNIVKNGSGTFNQQSNSSGFTGTLTVNAGTFITSALATGTFNFNPVSIVVNSGGTYQFGVTGVGDPNLPNSTYITVNTGGTVNWQIGEQMGGFQLRGGTLTLQSGGPNSQGTTAQTWTGGTVNGGGSAVAGIAITKTTAGTVTLSGGATITATAINVTDGTFAYVNAANLVGSASQALTLGGATAGSTAGTIEYHGTNTTRATGTFTLNAGGGAIKVTNPTTTLTLSIDVAGSGPLAKTGPGTLLLNGALTGTGTTTAAEGILRVNPGTAAGGFAVAAGGTLAINSGAGNPFSVPTLALAGPTAVLQFDLDSPNAPGSPLATVTATDGLTGGGTLKLNNVQAFANGTYQLIGYAGAAVSSGYSLSLAGRTAGSLSYATPNVVSAVITGTDTIRWGGQVNGTWDTGTAANVGGTLNWKLNSNGNATNFIAGDSVTFDDTAATFAVAIPANVTPSNVAVVNTANDYTFAGAGAIAGPIALSKSGTGTLRLANDNTYTGGTAVNAGTLQLGNGGTAGTAGTGTIALAGGTTLRFDRSDAAAFGNAVTLSADATLFGLGTATLSGTVTGTGTLTKSGPGTITLSGNSNPFTGSLVVNAGTVVLNDAGAGGDLGAASIVVNGGGTFQFAVFPTTGNTDLPDNTYVTINTGGNVVWNEGENFGGIHLLGGTLTARAGMNFVGTADSQWQSGTVTVGSGASGTPAIGSTGAIVKTTSGTVTVTGVALNNTGGISILDGVLATDSGFSPIGTLTLGDASTAGTLRLTNADTAAVGTLGAKPINMAGAGTIEVTAAGKTYTHTGILQGGGTLTKAGPGTLELSGTSSNFPGSTVVAAGILRVFTNGVARPYAVGTGGTLAFANANPAAAFAVSAFDLSAAGAKSLRFELTGPLPAAGQSVAAAETLTTGGTVNVAVTSATQLAAGQYPLVKYGGAVGGAGFAPFQSGTLTLPFRIAGNLVNNAANGSIDLAVTGADFIRWNGTVAGGVWDIDTTPNFKLNSTGAATTYIQNGADVDSPVFDDTAAGTTTVQLNVAVAPAAVRFDNTTKTYTLQGAGGITGTAFLIKTGTGTTVIATNNTYTGGTTITAGTLQLGDGGTAGSVTGGISLAAGTTLAVKRSDAISFVNPITLGGPATFENRGAGTVTVPGTLTPAADLTVNAAGTGGIVFSGTYAAGFTTLTVGGTGTTSFAVISGGGQIIKNDAGTLVLIGNSSFSGSVVINGGTVLMDDVAGTINATSIVVNAGGTYRFAAGTSGDPNLPNTTYITANTGGTIEWNIGEVFGGINLFGGTLLSRTSTNFSGTQSSDWRSGFVTAVPGTGAAVTGTAPIIKSTSDIVTVTGVALNNTGGLTIQEGVLATDSAIIATGTLTLGGGPTTATLRLTNTATGPYALGAKPVTLDGNGGTIEVTTAGKLVTLTGAISGSGGLTKAGPGTFAPSAVHTYTGPTTVAAGVLAGTGTFASAVTVQGGATLAPGGTAAGTITLQNGVAFAAGSTFGVRVTNGTTPAPVDSGGSTVGPAASPTSNGFLNVTGVTAAFDQALLVTVDGTGTALGGTYSYRVAQGAGDLSGLSVTNQAQFTAVGFTGSNFSLNGDGDGNVYLNFTAAVPEPATVLAFAASGLGLVRLARHRRKVNV